MNKKELKKFIDTYCDCEPQYLSNRDMIGADILVNGECTGMYVDDFMGVYSLNFKSFYLPPLHMYNTDKYDEQYFLYHFQEDVECLTYDEAVEKVSWIYENVTKPLVKAALEEAKEVYKRLVVDGYDFKRSN